ncbi:MAG TPA: chromosomal replication initiator protein DnaA [Nitrospirae bacterium]|nr:chromosomal replication initiator protein DnaA [bacterium BMS3Bbin08]HDH50453.1 chromosomal replication initiator protein DnaA [Nitrospirota bacterium]HDK16596.1 chromosomal replication initiator protein DnaA [Nitrospirota bacterium]
MKIEDAWVQALDAIKEKVGTQTFELWFKPLKFLQFKDHNLVLEVPNRFFREWIEDHYLRIISETIEGFMKEKVGVDFKLGEVQGTTALKKIESRRENRRVKLASRGIFLNPKYTFANFVVGASNQFARAAARAVAESPGREYNPLFIYGGVGLGKTHLMNAIGNLIIDSSRDVKLLYMPAEQFTNEFVYSMRNNRMDEFKGKFRNLDVILIDDIQFIAGKSGTQEELFHTFNALYDTHKQIVFSSDRPPRDISPITERLRSRFGMGLIADIQLPDTETKLAILGKKSELEGIPLPQDVALLLASKIKSNIRELEACMIRLGAHSSLSGRPITLEMAKEVLKDLIRDDERALSVESIQKTVCEYYGLKIQDIKAKKRTRDIAFPRQVAMFLSKTLTDSSLSDVGKHFGGKDHSTVIHACKQVEIRRDKDEDFKRRLDYLVRKIRSCE